MNSQEMFVVSDTNPSKNINLQHCFRVSKTNYGIAFYITFTTFEGREVKWFYKNLQERDAEFNKILDIFGRKLSEYQ